MRLTTLLLIALLPAVAVAQDSVTVAAQSGISVDVDGTADHVAIIDDTNTTLKLVTTLSSSQSVSAGGTMDTDAFDEEIEDPA